MLQDELDGCFDQSLIRLQRIFNEVFREQAQVIDRARQYDLPKGCGRKTERAVIVAIADQDGELIPVYCCGGDTLANQDLAIVLTAMLRMDGERAEHNGTGRVTDRYGCHAHGGNQCFVVQQDTTIGRKVWCAFANTKGSAGVPAGPKYELVQGDDVVQVGR